MAAATHYTQYQQTGPGTYDTSDPVTTMFTPLERDNSMDLVNDPRFFNGNVIEKRLIAFSGLNVVGTWVLANSVGQLYSLKKDFNFGSINGYLQFGSFCVMCLTSFCLIIAIFIQTNQMYYVHRLMTGGPTGFEQAALYYLNKTITRWRHLSIRCLMWGLIGYMAGSGCILSVKFVKDAAHAHGVVVHESPTIAKILAAIVFSAFCMCACLLHYIWHVHTQCFRTHHTFAYNLQSQLTYPMVDMASRPGHEYVQTHRTAGGHVLDM